MAILRANHKIFTPNNIVKKMLNISGYKKELHGKKILENSCGTGNFLSEVVKRYIRDGRASNLSDTQISKGIEQDIYGVEIDEKLYEECIGTLNKILKSEKIPPVSWKIFNEDALSLKMSLEFDFVVGNPPYIAYSALSNQQRLFIKSSYHVCQFGKPDYYFAFIESSINMLSSGGKLIYIVPNNFFKIDSGENLRNFIKNDLKEIYDYKSISIFQRILTNSVLLLIEKNSNLSKVKYHDMEKELKGGKYKYIDKSDLNGKWMFGDVLATQESLLFSDYFSSSISVATQLNNAFVLTKCEVQEDEEFFWSVESDAIEKEFLKATISPKNINKLISEYIIFPYYYEKHELRRYSEEYIKENFPLGYQHMLKQKEKLLKRDADTGAKWFEYGRSQALAKLNQPKLVLSTIATHKIIIEEYDKNVIPYSGIFIIQKDIYPLSLAKKILESQDFMDYIENIGVYVSGSSIRFSSKDINNYRFDAKLIDS